MTGLLDTSVVVRYLTDEPQAQAERAMALIESDEQLAIPVVALLEASFVLGGKYGVPRAEVVDALIMLVERPNVTIHELPKAAVIEALLLCRPSNRTSFADAMIWAAARTSPEQRVYTFDRRFPAVDVARELMR